MKLNILAAACGLALASIAGQASAQAVAPFEAPDITIYLSGASAPQNGIGEITEQLFDKTQNFYVYSNNTSASDYRAYFGRTKVGVIASGQKKVLLINRARGGSVFGVNPVARSEYIQTINRVSPGCAIAAYTIAGLTGVTGYYAGCPLVGNDANPADTTGAIPDFGVSDVSPYMFKGPSNVEAGSTELTPTELGYLLPKTTAALSFGIVATNAVPSTVNLSRNVYGQLLSGATKVWDKVPGAGTGNVVVCRRVPGSGTQATYNWYFGGFPCTSGNVAKSVNAPLAGEGDSAGYLTAGSGTSADPYVIDPTAGYTVIENSTSGDVRNCLQKANAGGVHTYNKVEVDPATGAVQTNYYSVNFGTGGYKAVGVLSLDSSGKENGWSFRALEGTGTLATSLATDTTGPAFTGTGVGPTRANLVEGLYDFVGEVSYQKNVHTGALNNYNAFSTDKKNFIDAFIAAAGNPATLEAIAGVPGVRHAYAALITGSTNVPAIDATTDLVTNNVVRADRNGNQCGPLVRKY